MPWFSVWSSAHSEEARLPPRPGQDGLLEAPVNDLDLDELCIKLERQINELEELRKANTVATHTIESLQSQLAQAEHAHKIAVSSMVKQINDLQISKNKVIADFNELKNLKNKATNEARQTIGNLRTNLSSEKALRNKDKQIYAQTVTQTQQTLEGERQLRAKQTERIKIEAAKIPISTLQSVFSHKRTLPIQPFVVVLVDGDSYHFRADFVSDASAGGTRAAQRMNLEVFKYLMTRGDIPLHAQVIVRVFINAGSYRCGKKRKDGTTDSPYSFITQFSETYPSFDFIDCGSGKERADTKIRNNFELFVSNPYCHAILLAICYDNGFVRMLEGYQYLDTIQEKIVLVHSGEIAKEYHQLPFKRIELSCLFKPKISTASGFRIASQQQTLPAHTPAPSLLTSDHHDEPSRVVSNVQPASGATNANQPVSQSGLFSSMTPIMAMMGPSYAFAGIRSVNVSSLQNNGARGVAIISQKNESQPSATIKSANELRAEALQRVINENRLAAAGPGLTKKMRSRLRVQAQSLESQLNAVKRKIEGQRHIKKKSRGKGNKGEHPIQNQNPGVELLAVAVDDGID